MKAKVKETGKVIEVTRNRYAMPTKDSGASYTYLGEDGKNYLDTDLDFINVYPDWQQVRIQAAIAAMQGLLSTERLCTFPNRDIAKYSVSQADALIEELKKKED